MNEKKIVLNERDNKVFRYIDKYRVVSIKGMSLACGIDSIQYTSRRVKKLTDYGYTQQHAMYYSYAHFYGLTSKGMREIGITGRAYKPSYTTAMHYTGVAEIAAYLAYRYELDVVTDFYVDRDFYHNEEINEEYQLKTSHKPDIIFTKDGTTYFVEYERSRKRKKRILDNLLMNALSGVKQIWVLDKVPFEDIKRECRESPHYGEDVTFMEYRDIARELKRLGGVRDA